MKRVGWLVLCMAVGAPALAPGVSGPADPEPGMDYRERMRQERAAINRGKAGVGVWSEDGAFVDFYRYATEANQRYYPREDRLVESVETEENLPRRPPRIWGRRGRYTERLPSPDGRWIAVHRDYNVFLEQPSAEAGEGGEQDLPEADPVATIQATTIPVTSDGERWMRYGTISWLYREDKGQYEAMWWSPDAKKLAFYKFDERKVPKHSFAYDYITPHTQVRQRAYPNPGEPVPAVTMFIYDLATGTTTPVDCGPNPDQYIYNVRYTPDGRELLFSRLDRRQRHMETLAADVETGRTRLVFEMQSDTWQLNKPATLFLEDGRRFILTTWDSGFSQYELRHLDGSRICTLTRGAFPVRRIIRVDEEHGWLYYSAFTREHPMNLQLYRVGLDGRGQRRLTPDPAINYSNFSVSPGNDYFMAQAETINLPASTHLFDLEGNLVKTLAEGDMSLVEDPRWPQVEIFSYLADDGETVLYGSLSKPRDFDPEKTYPLALEIYNGPGAEGVKNVYQLPHGATRHGFLVAFINGRGTSDRGEAFLKAVYRKMGILDLKDQVDGVRLLCRRPYVDADRVGVYGTSHGGYMAAQALFQYPDVFKCSVANAGVMDNRYYTAIYIERFMDLPEENPEGYEQTSCFNHIDRYRGGLLIQHGMIDDNVHMNSALRLVDELSKTGKPFEMRLYPNNGHWIGSAGYAYQWEFLKKHLFDEDTD